MYIVMLGPPGCGKGTQTEFLQNDYDLPTISTGDLFRYNIKNMTDLGKLALRYMEKGQLVPDDVTTRMLVERIRNNDCKDGYILDGYPRNPNQADELEKICPGLDLVLNICAPDDVILERICSRVTGSDNKIYNLITNPPPKGMAFTRRCDDEPLTVRKRLDIYHLETQPLIDYYSRKDLLYTIDGTLPPKEVAKKVAGIINQKVSNKE